VGLKRSPYSEAQRGFTGRKPNAKKSDDYDNYNGNGLRLS
jgi:hypothetical protein